MTIREQILQALGTALNASRPGTVAEFVRTRRHRLTAGSLPANTWFPWKDQPVRPTGRSGSVYGHTLRVLIDIVVGATDTQPPDQLVDAAYAWVRSKVVGKDLGHLANSIDEDESDYQFGLDGKTPFCRLRMVLVIKYQTRVTDAEQVA